METSIIYRTVQVSQIILEVEAFDGSGAGGGEFAKFVTLVQFYKLSMFPIPCFIVSDANYDSMTCNSNPLLIWPPPRCNEDPDCRNPCGFRIVDR